MKKMYLKIAVTAIVACLLFTACRCTKTAKTPEQKVSMDRGVQMDKEECEELALKETKNWRESGNGVSPK
jgi:outer membrane biogenesis lipoprotein LolB